MQLLMIPIAIAATVLTYVVSHHVINAHTTLGSARPLATMIALLTGLSLLSLGNGVVMLILIPYAALGLSLLLLPLLRWLLHRSTGRNLNRGLQMPVLHRLFRHNHRSHQDRKASTSAHLHKTPPPEE